MFVLNISGMQINVTLKVWLIEVKCELYEVDENLTFLNYVNIYTI